MEPSALLDTPIRHRGRLNPDLDWFWDQLPARAQELILKAARGEIRALGEPLPPAETLREFIQWPKARLMAQRNSGRKTFADLCHALRACGVTEPLFPDEASLSRRY